MKKNFISSNEIIERESSQILKEIDTNRILLASQSISKLSKQSSNDYESISSSENNEQQVPRIESKSSLVVSKSCISFTPKRPSQPPPLPPRLIGCSLSSSSSSLKLLKSKNSFNKKYDAPKLENVKKIPPPLPLQPPPPIPQSKVRTAPKPPVDLEKRFNFLPIPSLDNLPKLFDLPKERKYLSESNCIISSIKAN